MGVFGVSPPLLKSGQPLCMHVQKIPRIFEAKIRPSIVIRMSHLFFITMQSVAEVSWIAFGRRHN